MPDQNLVDLKKQKRRIILSFIYIALTIGIIIAFGLIDPNVKDVFGILGSLKLEWFFAAVIAMLLFWLFESLILLYLMPRINSKITVLKAIKISMIGLYYSALTPFASGGQPMQVAYMKKEGVSVGKSTGLFCVKFIVFQCVICLLFLAGIFVNGIGFFQQTPTAIGFATLGIVINLAVALFVLFAVVNKKVVLKSTMAISRFLSKIKIIKNLESTQENLARTLDEYHAEAGFMAAHKKTLVGAGLLTIIQMVLQFSITYCIYRAFGLNERSFLNVIFMQAILYVTVSFVPLPGASIASEGGFYLFFAMFFPKDFMFIAMMLWRVFTYYANILVGAGFVVVDAIGSLFKKKQT